MSASHQLRTLTVELLISLMVRVTLVGLGAAALLLANCTSTLGGSRAAPINPEAWIDELDDYPAGPMRQGESGKVVVSLLPSPEGRVATCKVVVSSGSSRLDGYTCSTLKRRARFKPFASRRSVVAYRHEVDWDICAISNYVQDGLPRPTPFDLGSAHCRAVIP